MSSLYCLGDPHGRIDEYLAALASLPKDAETYALGDLYLGRPGVSLHRMENSHHFLVGNHDAKSVAKAHPNYVGDYGYIPEQEIFFLSGAYTVSAPVLQNSSYWYKDEELSVEELDAALALYRETKPRILLSHEGPAAIVEEMLNGVDGNYHEAKKACVTSRTAIALQGMIDRHAPEHHIFAHHHRRWTAQRGRTAFRCLKELELCEVTP
jgi:hypothetical protein